MAKKNNNSWENNFGIPIESQVEIPENEMKEYLKSMQLQSENVQGWIRATLKQSEAVKQGYNQVLIQKDQEGKIAQRIAVKMNQNGKIEEKMFRETRTSYNDIKNNIIKEMQGIQKDVYQNGQMISSTYHDFMGRDIIPKNSNKNTTYNTKKSMKDKVLFERDQRLSAIRKEFDGSKVPHTDSRGMITNPEDAAIVSWYKHQEGLTKKQLDDAISRINKRYNTSFEALRKTFDSSNMPGEKMLDGRFSEVAFGKDGQKRYMTKEVDTINAIRDQAIAEVEKIYNNTPSNYVPKFKSPEAHQKYLEKRVLRETQNIMSGINSGAITSKNFNLTLDKFINVNDFVESFKPIASTFSNINEEIYSGLLEQGKTQLVSNMKNGVFSLGRGSFNGSKFDTSKIIKQIIDKTQIGKDKVIDNPQKANEIMSAINKKIEERIKNGVTSKDKATAFTGTNFLNNAYIDKNISSIAKSNTPLTYFDFETIGQKEGRGFQPTQLSVRSGDKSFNSIIKLNNDSIDYINSIFDNIKNGQALTDDEYRTITDLADYSIDATNPNKISAFHKKIKKGLNFNLSENQAIFNQIKEGFNILQGLTPDGKEASYTNLYNTLDAAMNAIPQDFNNSTWVAHNGRNFDTEVFRHFGVDFNKKLLDTLELSKGLYSYGQKRYYDKNTGKLLNEKPTDPNSVITKTLKGYTLDNLADFFNIDLKMGGINQHTSEYDTELNRRIAEQMFADISGGKATEHRLKGPLVGKKSVSVPVGSIGIAGKTKIRDHRDSFKIDASGKLLRSEDNSFNDIQFRKNGIYSYDGFFEFENGKYAKFTDQETGQQVLEAYRDYEELNKNLTKHFDGKFSTMDSISSEASAFSSIFKKDTGIHNLRALGKLIRNKDDNTVTSGQKVRFSAIKKDSIKNVISSLDEMFSKSTMSDDEKSLVLSNIGKQMGINSTSMFTDNDIRKQIDDSSRGSLSSVKNAYVRYMNENKEHFKDSGVYNSILSSLKTATTSDLEGEVNAGSGDFYGISRRIYDAFDSNYLESLQNTPKIPEKIHSNSFIQAATKAMESAKMQFSSANKSSVVDTIFNNADDNVKNAMSGKHIINRLKKLHNIRNDSDSPLMRDIEKLTGTIASNQGLDNQSVGGMLKAIEKQASAAGLGFGLKLNPDGSGLGLQIFNNSDMEANEDGSFFVPKSKSLFMTVPLDSGNGIINHNGMDLTNFLIPEMTEGGLRINTSTESIVRHLQSVLANPKLKIFDKMKNGNVGYGQSILNSVVKNALDTNPSAGTYKVSSVSDLYDTYKAGGSSVARAAKMGHGLYTNFFENIFQRYAKDDPELNNMNDFQKHQAIEQIRSWYSAVSFNKGDIPENDPKYDWLLRKNATARQYALNQFNALRSVMPVDLTGIKESGFDSNVIPSMSANRFSLFGEFAPQEWRGINQGTNIIGGVGNASEESMQNLNIERDIFETGVGQSVGVDYSVKARPQIYTGLLSEKQMYEGYNEYIDNLKKMDKQDGGHRYTDFYNKHGAFAPSLFEGSFVMSENLLNETTGKRGQVVSVDSLDELKDSFKNLPITSNGTLWTNLISKDGDKVTLGNDGNGYAFENDIDITYDKSFYKGDVLRSIEKKDGKYLLSFDEQIQAHRGSKFVGNEGNRLTEDTGGMPEDFMDFMRKKYNLDPRVQQFMPQVDKLRDRDLPMHVGGRYKYLLTEALKRNPKMSVDDINNKLASLADNGVLAGKYFKATTNENGNISFTDNIHYDRDSSSWMDYSGNKVFNTQDEFNNFMNTEKEGSDFEKLAQGFLGNNWRDIIKDNTLLTNTSLANEYEYFQGFGSGLDDMLSADGRVKMSIKEKDSIDRKLGLYSRKSGDYKNLSELLHQYVENKSESYRNAQELAESYKTMGTDFFEVNKGGNLRSAKEWLGNQGNVLKIVRRTSESQKLADNEIDVDDLARGAEWVKEAKGISLENWKETAAGMIHTKGTEAFGGQPFKVAMMLENPNDPSKSDYFSTTMPGDDLFDNVKGVSTLMFNPVGPNIIKDGIVSPTDDDYLLRDVFRSASTKHRNENNATWLDDTTKAYSKYYRYTFDQVAHKDSPLFKLLHTNKVANATATKLTGLNAYEYDNLLKQTQSDDVQIRNKAQSKFNTMANTLFLNEDHVRDMLSVEEGSDIDTYKKHFENLSRMYDEMYNGDSTIDKLLSGKKFGDNIKGYKNRISSILDQIVKDITINENGVTKKSLTGFLHRYPSTSGLDEILANINIDKGLPKGVSSLGIGLATRMNADWDGDVIRAAIPWLKNDVDLETFKQAYKEAEYIKSKENEVSKMVAERRASKENFNASKQDLQDADMWTSLMDKVVHNKDTSDFAGIVAKNNFDFIGQFSTFATSIRGALKKAKLDEITPNLSDAEKMQAMTVRAVFESIEQDAISSKKVASRLMNNARAKLGKDATSEQLQTHVMSEMQNLVSILYGHDQDGNKISDKQKVNGLSARMDKAFSYGKEIGLFGEGEEFLNGRQAWTAIAQMYHMGKTPEQQESIRKMMYENGLITQDHKIGTLSEDFVRKSLGQVERTVEERYHGKNLYTLGKEYRNNVAGALSYDFYGKKMAEMARTLGLSGNDESTAKTSQQQGVQQVIGQGLSGTNLGNVNIEAISAFIQALGLATQGVQSFTGAVTGDLSSSRRDLSYSQLLGNMRDSKGLGIATLDVGTHTYKVNGVRHERDTSEDIPIEQKKIHSVTEIANALFAEKYDDLTPALTKDIDKILEDGYIPVDGKNITDLKEFLEKSTSSSKEADALFARYSKGKYATIQGTMTHKALEILRDNKIDNADVLFGDGKNLKDSELSAYNDWQTFLSGSEGSTYLRQLKQIGKTFDPDATKTMAKQGFLGLKDGGISELSLGMKIGNHEIFGTLDAFFNGRLFDYKTTEGMHPDQMGFQLGMLKRLILENGNLLVNDPKTSEAFKMYKREDGTFDIEKFSNPDNFKAFIANYDKNGRFEFDEMHIPEGNALNTLLADFYSGVYKTTPLLWKGYIKDTFGHTSADKSTKEVGKLVHQRSILGSMLDTSSLEEMNLAKQYSEQRTKAQSELAPLISSGFNYDESGKRINEIDTIFKESKVSDIKAHLLKQRENDYVHGVINSRLSKIREKNPTYEMSKSEMKALKNMEGWTDEEIKGLDDIISERIKYENYDNDIISKYGSFDDLQKEKNDLIAKRKQYKSSKKSLDDAERFFKERDPNLEGFTLLKDAENKLLELEDKNGLENLRNKLKDDSLTDEERKKIEEELKKQNRNTQNSWKATDEYKALEKYKENNPVFDSTIASYNLQQNQKEAMAQEYLQLELQQKAAKGLYGVDSDQYKLATQDLENFKKVFSQNGAFWADFKGIAEAYKETDEYKAMEEKAYQSSARDYAKGITKDSSQSDILKQYEKSKNQELTLTKSLNRYKLMQQQTDPNTEEWQRLQTIIDSITAQLREQQGITGNIASNLNATSKNQKDIIDKNAKDNAMIEENAFKYRSAQNESRSSKKEFDTDKKNANQYYKEMTKINEDIAKLQGKANKSRGKTKEHYLNEIAQKEAYRKNIEGVYADRGIYYTYDAETGTGTFKNAKGEITSQTTNKAQAEAYYRDYTAMNLRYNERLRTTQAESQRVGFFDKMKGSIKGAAEYMMFTSLGYSIIGSIRGEITKIIQQTRQLEKTMTDLRIVTGGSEDDVQSLMYSYQQLGSQLGLTTAEVSASANEWLRMGYNAEQANTMIYNSAMLAKLGMIDTAKATEYMVSAVKGYNVAIQDAEKIVDMATSLDMKYAVSAGYILEAMARTASGAKLAKVEMSELQSLIAVIGETTQKDASVIGESLKTAFSRYANVKATAFVKNPNLSGDENLMNQYALETEASESGDATAVNDIEKVLKVVDIDIRNGEEWRSYSDILKELGEGWKTYSDYEKNAIVTAMFGTRQRENGIVALTNYNRVLEANEVAINSVGTATQKMEIYSQGLEAAQNRVTAAWEKLVMDLEAGGVIQNVSETIESLIGNFKLLATVIGSGVLIANLDKVYVALTKFSVLFNSKMAMGASLGKGLLTGNFSAFKERMSSSHIKAQEIATDGTLDINNIWESKLTKAGNAVENFGNKLDGLSSKIDQSTVSEQQENQANIDSANSERMEQQANVHSGATPFIQSMPIYNAPFNTMNPSVFNSQFNPNNFNNLGKNNGLFVNNNGQTFYQPTYSSKVHGGQYVVNPNVYNHKMDTIDPKKIPFTPNQQIGVQIGSMATGMIGMFGGSGLGSKIAEEAGLDETGQMMGSVIGGGLVSTISSSLMMSGNPHAMIGGAALSLGSMIGSWIWGAVKKKKENALKELTKDLAEVEEKYNNLTSIDTEDKVAKWDELSQGVNSFGENVSLTNTQYEEYLSLSNEIGEMFPDLISRTDAFGNSIINVGDDVDTLTEKLEKMQETSRNETIDAYFREKDGVSNASQAFDDFKKKADAKEIEKYGSVYTGSEMNPTQLYINWDEINISDEEKKELIKEAQKYLNKNFAPNLYSDDFKTQWNSVSTLYDVTTPDELWDKLSAFADKKIFEIEQKYKKTEMVKNTADYRSKLIEDVIGFKDLGGEISSFLMNFTAGVDVTQFENEEDYQNFLKDHIINLYNDANDKDNVKNSISNLKDDLNNETKSLAELNESYNTNIGSAKGNIVNHINGMKTDEERKDFYSKYGLTYEKTEDGTEILKNSLGEEVSQEKFIEEYTGFQNVGKNLIDELINKTGTKEDFVKKLNQGEAKFLNSLSIDTLDLIKKDKNFKTWEDSLQNYLDNHYVNTIYSAKSNLEKLVKDNKDAEDALSQLFEDYNEDNIEKFLLTLNSDDAKKALKYFEDMDKRAKILGLDIEDAIKKASVLSHIDIYGRSSKSVKQASDDASQILEWKQAVANGTLTPEQFDEMKLVSPKAASETDPDKIIEALDESYIKEIDVSSAIVSAFTSNNDFYKRAIDSEYNTNGLTDDLIKNFDSGIAMKEAFELGLSDEQLTNKELVAGIKTLLGDNELSDEDALSKFKEMYNITLPEGETLESYIQQHVLKFIDSGILWDGPNSFLQIEAKKMSKNVNNTKAAEDAYKELRYAQRDYIRAKEDYEEKQEDIAKQRRLNELEKELSEKSRIIQKFTNEINNYDFELELLPEIDYEGRIDILGNKIGSLANKNAELKKQMSEVANKTPESAEEAQKLKETYDNLYSSLQENQKSIISIKKELNSLTVDALMSPFSQANNLFDKQKSLLEKSTSLMTSSVDVEGSWKIMSFSGLYDFTEQSELEKKRKEYEDLIEEQEKYQNKSLEMDKIYQDKRYKDTFDDLNKEAKRSYEDYTKTVDDFRKKVEEYVTTHADSLKEIVGEGAEAIDNMFKLLGFEGGTPEWIDKINKEKLFKDNVPETPVESESEKDNDILTVSDDVITIPEKDDFIPLLEMTVDDDWISSHFESTLKNIKKVKENVDKQTSTDNKYKLNPFGLHPDWESLLPKEMNEKVDEAIDDVNGQDRTFVAPTPDEMTWTNFGTRIGEYISNGIVNGVENGEYAVATSNPFNFNIPLKGWNSSSDAINPNMSSIQKGQTLYFHSKSSPLYGHVGIYDGNGGVYHRAGGNGYSYTPFSEMVSGSNYTYVGAGWNGGNPLTTNQADALIENIKANKVADPGQGYCQKWVASAYQTVTGKYRSILSPENAIRAGWVTSTESPLFKALYASQQQENKNGLLLLIQNAMQNYGLGQNLGWLSQMYEGNVGTIANNAGDFGGKSYGIPQFSLSQGSLQSFVNWLSSKDAKFAKPLTDTLLGTSGFDAMWKQIAKEQPDKFARYQQEYAYNTMAIPQAKKIYDKYGIDMTRSAMVREALISMAYQYNNLASSLLNGATKDMSDLELIELIYANKAKNVGSHFRSSSQGIRNAISNRIINEKSTLLNAYSYAYGTTGHQGGLALIGDENLLEGSNKPSPELAIYPNGQVEIVGQDGAEIRDLPKGTQIVPTDLTKSLFDIPNYADGTDVSLDKTNDILTDIKDNTEPKSDRTDELNAIDKVAPTYLKNIAELFDDPEYKNLVLSYQNINTSKLNRQQQKEHVLEEYDERILNETNPFKKQDLKNYQALFSKEDEVLYDMQTLNAHMNMRDYMIDFYRSHIEQWQADSDYDTINKFQEAIVDVTEKIEDMQKSVEKYVEEMYEISALTYKMRERYREHNAQMLEDAYEFGQIGVKTEENYFAELKADAAASTESARVAFEDAKAALYKQVIVENGGSYEDFLAEMKTNETIQKAQQEINNSIKNEKQVRKDEFDYFIENLERAFNELEVSIGMIANKTTDLLRVSLLTDESSKAMTALSKIDEIRIRLQDPYLSESQQRDYQKQINEQNNIIFESIDEYLSGRLQNANTIATNTINQLTSADSAGVITGINKYKRRNGDFRQAINSNFYETQIEAYEEERETIVQTLVDREAELSKMAEEKGVSVEELKAVDSIWNEGIESYYQSLINVQEKLREELDAKLELIDMDQKILDLNKQQEWSSIRNIENYYGETQANLQAKRAELIDYMEMTEISYEEYLAKKQELADINKQIIDSSLEELQAKQSFYNEQYGAMTFMVNEYTDALNEEKERVSDYYDEEIRKLQQVNDSKERSIKLTELQNNLDNAKKEKKRVYRAGIGFVYEEDRDAVKKAEDELDAFYRQDQLDSLNDAKDMELKILDDRIEGWNKYLEAIEKVYKTAERHHNMELLKTMFGIEGEVNWDNIFEFLNSDMGSYLTEDKLGEHIYYGELTSWLRTYTGVSEDIYDEVSAIHDVLWNLPEYNGSNEDYDDAMYGKETSKELKLLDAINYEEYNFKQMLDSANNKYWRDVVAEHPEITDFSALTDEELEKYGLNSNEAKALHNQKLIEMSEFVREGNVLDRNGNIVGYDDSYKDIAAILDGSKRNTTNWSFEELQQARYLKLELQKNSGEITEEQYKELYKPVEYSNENLENFLNNPANQIMTKNDLISALKETYQMSDNTILNILLKYLPIISKNVEGSGEIIFKNIEELQNELISSGKDIGDILKKSDTEIFAETGLKREYVEEARRIKQEKINNLVDTVDDWENLKANNNTGLSMNDIIYAERLQKNNINSHISETGDVAKNQQLVKNNKPIEVNGTSLIDFDIDSTGKITNGYLENLSKNSDEQTELMRASLGITHGMMSPIEVVSKNDMYLSMSQNPTVSKEVTPIDFKGVKFGIANSSLMDYPKITSLLANNKENITNNNGNINVFVSKGTNLPAIQYASTLEHTNKQDNLV